VSVLNKPLISPLLFGRTEELEIIAQSLQRVRGNQGECLLIYGDAGVGKSRLIAAAEEIAGKEQFDQLYGVCFEQDMTLPYGPWIYAIRQYLSKMNSEQIVDALGDYSAEIIRLVPELSSILSKADTAPELAPEAEKWRLFEALARQMTFFASQHPLLIVLEDLHWGDETSLELIQFCARRFTRTPILLIGTYRNDDLSPQLKRFLSQMNRERLATEIPLTPLSRHHIAEMIRAIFKIERPIKLDFLDMIVRLTGGNPFFVEEVLKSLVESGGIYPSGEGWERRPVVELRVPSSTRDAVQSRLELLSDRARSLVTLMSVAGRLSSFDLLQALTHASEEDLIRDLKALIEAQLIVEAAPDQFTFRHELTREAVNATLMQRERRMLHRMIAETIERVFSDNLDSYQASLAIHFEKSGQWEKALEYARQAGEKALALYAPREALEHFNSALEASHHLSLLPELRMYRARGLASQFLGNFDQAQSDFQTSLEIARSSGDVKSEWQALIDLALVMEGRNYSKAGDFSRQALEISRRLHDPALIGHSLIRITVWYTNMNQPEEGTTAIQEALQIFRDLGDEQGLALALSAQGNIYMNTGDFRRGYECYTQALPYFKESGDLQGQFNCLINLSLCGSIDLYYTEPPMISISRARRYAESALEIARQMNSQPDEAISMIRVAMILRTQGRYAQALDLAENATELADGLDHAEWSSFGWSALGEIQRDLLNLDLAREYYERSLDHVDRSGNLEIKETVAANLARVYLDLKQPVLAEKLLHDVLPENAEIKTMAQRLIQYGFARLYFEQGAPGRTVEILDSLLASSIKLSGQEDLQSPYLAFLRGDSLAALGRSEEARNSLHKARDAAGQMGSLPLLWRIHYSLARLEQTFDSQQAHREIEHAREIITHLGEALPDAKLRHDFIEKASAWLAFMDETPTETESQAPGGPLTGREMEVVALIKAGRSNQEIADTLVLSKRTVEKHISNILSKLMLNSRAQIIVWGIENEKPANQAGEN